MDSLPEQPTPPFDEQSQIRPGLDLQMSPRPRNQAPSYLGSGKLSGRRALITGGDSGIGASVAVLFAREGADVAIVYLPDEQQDADNVAGLVAEEGQRCVRIPGDITSSEFCRAAVDRTVEEFGGLDILVNNAAVMYQHSSITEISDEELDEVVRTNILGYFYMTRAAVPYLEPGSSIVNCGSVAGFLGHPPLMGYAETKGANHTFTKSLATSLIEKGVRVNCVSPGPVWTPLNASARTPEQMAGYGSETDPVPLGRPAQPEEIAPAFVFFASNVDSGFINGEILAIYGGEVLAR
ncbi:MAG: SDR family oxidoreductase [Ilumatobacter sp.]|nr:MAG: SDR family oxidoreductase [Ilumatobacter sp.]